MERVEVRSNLELRAWLEKNHSQKESVWLVRYKKHHPNYLDFDSMVRELLCYGWIDSLPRKLDDDRTMTRISPRNPKSYWSGLNKKHVAELEKEGLVQPQGKKMIALAKKTGTWNFLDDVEALVIPEDLEDALAQNPKASEFLKNVAPSYLRGVLFWIKSAKQESTRGKRLEAVVSASAKGERVPNLS
ncbi:MAG: YdeI/OmpD-associated family protein [Luteibaculum sp.]